MQGVVSLKEEIFLRKPFNVVRGNHVPCLDGIEEGYSIRKYNNQYQLTINVSAENIDNVFRKLCASVRSPGFLLLEHGTNAKIEDELRKSDNDPFHKDVYYLDGLEHEYFFQIYDQYKELLINDGEINFGFGSHVTMDEIFVGPYKIFTVFTDDIDKYFNTLSDLGIYQKDELKTVWDNITPESPGSRMTIKHNGIDIYKMVKLLTETGLYLAERRED